MSHTPQPEPTRVESSGIGHSYYDDVGENPLAINALLGAEVRRRLVHFFLVDADPDHAYNKSEIAEKTGMARSSVVDHIDQLVQFGVLRTKGENRLRYLVSQDATTDQLKQLNELLVENFRSS